MHYPIIEYCGSIRRPTDYEPVILLSIVDEGVVIPWKPNYSVKEAIIRWAQEEMVKEVG